MTTRISSLIRFMAAAFVLAAFTATPVFAQVTEDESVFDETEDELSLVITPNDVVAWRAEGEGLETGLALYLTDEKGDELYDITRLHVGETLYIIVRAQEVFNFQIGDPIANNRLFLNLTESDREIVSGMLPKVSAPIPKTRVVR